MKIITPVFAISMASSMAPAKAVDPPVFAQVDRIFADWRVAKHVPGLVYGVVLNGRLVSVRGLGVQDVSSKRAVTPDTLFRIASMSKAFTALAILKLRDEGKVALDSPAEVYVPQMRGWANATSDSPRVTVRNLLTHSAGLVEDNPWGDRQQVRSEAEFTTMLAAGVPFARGPGVAMEYSNFGYATLGRIVTNVSRVPYQDYIRRELMVPLGMRSTTYDIFQSPPTRRAIGYRWQDDRWVREPDMKDGAFGAMGGVETSANDYAKWVEFLLSAWPARDGPDAGPVKRSTVREIVTGANFATAMARNAAIGGACRQAVTYAMGWRVIDDCDLGRVMTHGGGFPGYGSVVLLLPDKGVGLFVFTNKTYGGPSVPAFQAALALKSARLMADRSIATSAGLTTAYEAAKAVWRAGDITVAPLGGNMLMDRDRPAWTKLLGQLKDQVGTCPATEAVTPISAMEGTFDWRCAHGRLTGRVQQAPTPTVQIQALEYSVATP